MSILRIIGPEHNSGTHHMAMDEAILNEVNTGRSKPTLRFYYFTPPSVTISKDCHINIVRVEACERAGICIARRPTGGSALYHSSRDFTYSLIAPRTLFRRKQEVEILREICGLITKGLRHAGIPATLHKNSSTDIMYNNKKLSGSASMIKQHAILVHGSIFDSPEPEIIAQYVKIDPTTLRAKMTSLPLDTPHERIRRGITTSIALEYNLSYTTEDPTNAEKDLATQILHEKFSPASAWLCSGSVPKNYCAENIGRRPYPTPSQKGADQDPPNDP